MTAASNSEGRKRRTVAADPVEIVAAVSSLHIYGGYGERVCTCGFFDAVAARERTYNRFESWNEHHAGWVVAALQAAGLLTPP